MARLFLHCLFVINAKIDLILVFLQICFCLFTMFIFAREYRNILCRGERFKQIEVERYQNPYETSKARKGKNIIRTQTQL